MVEEGYARAGRPFGAISTLVSLFLLLLVFFIVLFSIAQVHRQRVDEVVASIDRAFGGWPTRLGIAPQDGWAPVPGRDVLVADLSRLLGDLGSLGPAAGGGAVAEYRLNPAVLFGGAPDGVTVAPGAVAILNPLVVRLSNGLAEAGQVVVTLRSGPGGTPEAMTKRRLAALAAAFYEAGWPAEALRVEISGAGEPGLVLRIDGAPASP